MEPEPAPVAPQPPPQQELAQKQELTVAKSLAEPAAETKPMPATPDARAKPVIFPVSHAPDDPGPEEAQSVEDKKAKFRIFG